jgi:triphosphoribosyl-dephospho-CoA synthetase
VLQRVSLRISRLHTTHEGRRIRLAAGRGHHAMGHLRGHARLGARLARIVRHAGGHGVTPVNAGVLLHARMKTRAAAGAHTGHHGWLLRVSSSSLSTCVDIDAQPGRLFHTSFYKNTALAVETWVKDPRRAKDTELRCKPRRVARPWCGGSGREVS